jgi:DNA-binding transcriptional LysR family regulator
MAVTLTQLTAFLAVVREGSVRAAAESLTVTQPSVSAAVSALEREVGAQLTERSGRSVRPTEAGEAYAEYAQHVLSLLREGREVAQHAADGGKRRLRISSVTTAAEYLVPSLIDSFRKHWPELEFSLDVGNRAEVFERLARHEADVAITGRVPPNTSLRGIPFANHDFVLVTSPKDPLCKRQGVTNEELSARSWLVREVGSGTRILCEEYLAANDLSPQFLSLGSNGAIKSAAAIGLGVALQSRDAVAMELEVGLLATIRPRAAPPQRSWFVVTSSVGPTREPVEAFVRFVQSDEARIALELGRSRPLLGARASG